MQTIDNHDRAHMTLAFGLVCAFLWSLGGTCQAGQSDPDKPAWAMVAGDMVTRWAKRRLTLERPA